MRMVLCTYTKPTNESIPVNCFCDATIVAINRDHACKRSIHFECFKGFRTLTSINKNILAVKCCQSSGVPKKIHVDKIKNTIIPFYTNHTSVIIICRSLSNNIIHHKLYTDITIRAHF